ncbi:hypothetical protein TrVE_jg4354 [Triparma verrucosa]|uniref:Uncharacterized protein n=1 Tax=Triparma verrucosa TaxID=1606542 RepID=A0A9W7KY80_9STRA|nr:hypothetical protein TrVE_jg4354 [Triparma verrucosa]
MIVDLEVANILAVTTSGKSTCNGQQEENNVFHGRFLGIFCFLGNFCLSSQRLGSQRYHSCNTTATIKFTYHLPLVISLTYQKSIS